MCSVYGSVRNIGLCVLLAQSSFTLAEEVDFNSLDLSALLDIPVQTVSKREQHAYEAAASVKVITQKLIAQRGYRNLVDVLEDIPAFDFYTFEDGGGEYPVHGRVRGIGGDPGNSKLMVMIDGLILNHISFLWSQGWGEEMILDDVERIEVILGPGSALYGANAVTGIINIITDKKVSESLNRVSTQLSENNTLGVSYLGRTRFDDWHLSFAAKSYSSDGDMGRGRPDPGNYFSNNVHPNILTDQYVNGSYATNVANPLAGKPLKDGFNTQKDIDSVRLNLNYLPENNSLISHAGLGINYWDIEQGLGSYVVGYEYDATAHDHKRHSNFYSSYGELGFKLSDAVTTQSRLWYKRDQQKPDTGFTYNYRYNDMRKTYHSESEQWGWDQQFNWTLRKQGFLVAGFQYIENDKLDQVVSLGREGDVDDAYTASSWQEATSGTPPTLYQYQSGNKLDETKKAVYAVYEDKFTSAFGFSAGVRYDRSDLYGSSDNLRLGLIYDVPVDRMGLPVSRWVSKLLYGEAFREPSVFELNDEFRGEISLSPEQAETIQWVNQFIRSNQNVDGVLQSTSVNIELFYSEINDSISIVEDLSRAGGERYDNQGKEEVRGLDVNVDFNLKQSATAYVGYQYLEGKSTDSSWGRVVGTSSHKAVAGFNVPLGQWVSVDLAAKYYGKREVSSGNRYFNGSAPSYTKVDLTLTANDLKRLLPFAENVRLQLVVDNLLDKEYYGVGRQAVSGLRSELDVDSNPNPDGFIPAYHPQPGRRIFLNLNMEF